MPDSFRKKPGVVFWATVVAVVAMVAYPLSIAPAWWLCEKAGSPDWFIQCLGLLYHPLWTLALISDDLFRWLLWYSACLCGNEF